MTEEAADPPGIRSLVPSVYLPTFLFAAGQGAVVPIVALAAKDVGASVALAGAIVALRGIGTLAFDLPAGALVGRMGERRAMSVATALLTASLVGCVVAREPILLGLSMFVMGWGWSVWLLARLAYVSDVMPVHLRGRALSTLGGVQRIGAFAGPFAGALAITRWGTDGAYGVHIVTALLGWIVLLVVADPSDDGEVVTEPHAPPKFREVVRDHRHVFLTAGVAAMCLSVLRASRSAVLPLWADSIGLDAAAVAVIFGISSGLDMTLFYPAGSLSDRYGRRRVAIPCLTLMATGFLLLPATTTFTQLLAAGMLIGFGNGFGAGIVMTMGADFAPPRGRAEFLGVWRSVSDLGTAGGPLLAAAVAGVASLGAAATVVSALGFFGAAMVWRRVPETLVPSPPPR